MKHTELLTGAAVTIREQIRVLARLQFDLTMHVYSFLQSLINIKLSRADRYIYIATRYSLAVRDLVYKDVHL